MKQYQKVEIAATSEEEAREILDILLEKHFVAGGHFMPCETRHWWKEKVDIAKYYIVSGYTTSDHQQLVIDAVRNISSEEVPGIVFFDMDSANKDYLDWIERNT